MKIKSSAWAQAPKIGQHYYLFDDKSAIKQAIGEGALDCDGHVTLSPDRKWMLTDTYPDENHFRTLLLWQWPTAHAWTLPNFIRHRNYMARYAAICTRVGIEVVKKSALIRRTPAHGKCMCWM